MQLAHSGHQDAQTFGSKVWGGSLDFNISPLTPISSDLVVADLLLSHHYSSTLNVEEKLVTLIVTVTDTVTVRVQVTVTVTVTVTV